MGAEAGSFFANCEYFEAAVAGIMGGQSINLQDVVENFLGGATEPANDLVYGTTVSGTSAAVHDLAGTIALNCDGTAKSLLDELLEYLMGKLRLEIKWSAW